MTEQTNYKNIFIFFLISYFLLNFVGCSTTPNSPNYDNSLRSSKQGADVVVYALGLLGTGYKFGGKNPSAGLDCSGMVSYVYQNAIGMNVKGSAKDIAKRAKKIKTSELRPGDLVFFNTLNRPFSHVGIFIGDGKFIHSPNSRGSVRVNKLSEKYYSKRFEMAATLLN